MKWLDVPDWENLYEVSDQGCIRSKGRFTSARNNSFAYRSGRELKQVEKTNGYLCVTLTDGIRRPQLSVHHIVTRAFLGPCPLGLHVLHIDGNKRNNCIENLRYGTPKENANDTLRHGHRRRGDTHPAHKLSTGEVIAIRQSKKSAAELANEFGVTPSHIHTIISRRVWRHI